MKLTSENTIFIRWRTRAGHNDNGTWVNDDPPDARTGPLGKWHWARHDDKAACGQQLARVGGVIESCEVDIQDGCHNCMRLLLAPWLR